MLRNEAYPGSLATLPPLPSDTAFGLFASYALLIVLMEFAMKVFPAVFTVLSWEATKVGQVAARPFAPESAASMTFSSAATPATMICRFVVTVSSAWYAKTERAYVNVSLCLESTLVRRGVSLQRVAVALQRNRSSASWGHNRLHMS